MRSGLFRHPEPIALMSSHPSLASLVTAIILLLTAHATCCHASQGLIANAALQQLDIAAIKAAMRPLKPDTASYQPPPVVSRYFQAYGLDPANCLHLFGTFASQGQSLAGHIFIPPRARGSVFLVHGYYDHSGIFTNLIAFCLKQRLAVAVFDLPGHGLSGGRPFAIADFADYSAALTAFVDLCDDHLPRPFHLVAHSLGCAITSAYLQQKKRSELDKIIFLAPLVRSKAWLPSKIGHWLSRPFTSRLPRFHRRNSSDQHFLDFSKQDPLQAQMSIPMSFLSALYDWESRAHTYHKMATPLHIIQGSDDAIVDWRYNIPFLKTIFSEVQPTIITGANHQLVNESPGLRAAVFARLENLLGPKGAASSHRPPDD